MCISFETSCTRNTSNQDISYAPKNYNREHRHSTTHAAYLFPVVLTVTTSVIHQCSVTTQVSHILQSSSIKSTTTRFHSYHNIAILK